MIHSAGALQYNLHPDDLGDEESLASASDPQTETDEVFQCVPCWVMFRTEEELIQHRQSSACSQSEPVPCRTAVAQPAASTPKQQSQTQTGPDTSSVLKLSGPQGQDQNVSAAPQQPVENKQGKSGCGSGGLIQFQCGDCSCLFESLSQWLQHCKLQECRKTAPGEPGGQNSREQEGAEAGPAPAEAGVTEALTSEAQSESADAQKQITDSQNTQEEKERDEGERPVSEERKKKKKNATAAVTTCRSFQCGECGAGFSWQPALVVHRRTEHGLDEPLHQCLECEQSFMNTALFVEHCKTHRDRLARKPRVKRTQRPKDRAENGNQEKEIIRRRPKKTRLKTRTTSSALGSESEEKPKKRRRAKHECPQCGRSFISPAYLRAHVLGHSGQKQFRCEICDKLFTYRNNLRRHQFLHTGQRPYMCDRCGRTFTQASHLKCHIQLHDRGICSRSWPQNTAWAPCNSSHEGPKLPHACPDCPCHFATRTQLLMHRKMCPICERSFKWRGSLPGHIIRHTDNKLFSCHVCGKTFSYKSNLARHLIIHAGTRPYACKHCGKTFNQSSNLHQHLVVHTKGRAHRQGNESEGGADGGDAVLELLQACPDCPASFKTIGQLQQHRLSHLGQDSSPCTTCGQEPCTCQQQQDQDPNLHHESWSCPRCSTQFNSQMALDEHAQSCAVNVAGRRRARRRGGPRRTGWQVRCVMCSICCSSPEDLEVHQLSHVGQPQLKCPLSPCEDRFVCSSALQYHLNSHFPGPTCQNLRPEGLLDLSTPQPVEETEVETTVAVIPIWEVFQSDPAPAGP
ncbi:hypothetical protein GJAV_G00005990 [Gymnothorax javanicus]|nr:hypothetical protein GJAV_G00005990 [Gymnothorax javanicus]